jgi:hypothetical protein
LRQDLRRQEDQEAEGEQDDGETDLKFHGAIPLKGQSQAMDGLFHFFTRIDLTRRARRRVLSRTGRARRSFSRLAARLFAMIRGRGRMRIGCPCRRLFRHRPYSEAKDRSPVGLKTALTWVPSRSS